MIEGVCKAREEEQCTNVPTIQSTGKGRTLVTFGRPAHDGVGEQVAIADDKDPTVRESIHNLAQDAPGAAGGNILLLESSSLPKPCAYGRKFNSSPKLPTACHHRQL